MEAKDNYIENLIEKWIDHTISSDELLYLKKIVKDSAENRIYVRNRLEILRTVSVMNSKQQFDKDSAYEKFTNKVNEYNTTNKKTDINYFYRIAAIVLMLIIPYVTYKIGKGTSSSDITDVIVEVPFGSSTKMYLPDGTLVWLNSGTKMTYSSDFGVNSRSVRLNGEGYFEVTHNKNVPFKIETPDLSLHVLGTKFNFKNYSEDDNVSVELLEGKVLLNNKLKNKSQAYMSPNEKVVLNKKNGAFIKNILNKRNMKSWTEENLFFDEDKLSDIVNVLMRKYNVKIKLADSLKQECFYGSFNTKETNLESILKAITLTNRVRLKYENSMYYLY